MKQSTLGQSLRTDQSGSSIAGPVTETRTGDHHHRHGIGRWRSRRSPNAVSTRSASIASRVAFAPAAIMLAGLSACTPTINVNLGGGVGGPLQEVVVLADDDATGDEVAMIDVTGLIADARRPGLLSSGPNPVDQFHARLAIAEKDDAVRAVIIRINSPGGTVTGSDILHTELRRFAEKTKKPVIASMGEIAASGGYYLALASDHIIAEPTTITGSIGVIIPTMNFADGMARIGIRGRSVTSGPNKDLANPFEPMREPQYAVLQGMVDEFHARFKGLVVERRTRLPADRLADATDGRVVSGATAMEWGLVDSLGGIRHAFDTAKRLAGVSNARLVKYGGEGYEPNSPYARAEDVVPRSGFPVGATQHNQSLLQLNVSGAAGGIGGAAFATLEPDVAYYVWSPGL
jgi:protease IV